jgi:hypothetical protein
MHEIVDVEVLHKVCSEVIWQEKMSMSPECAGVFLRVEKLG